MSAIRWQLLGWVLVSLLGVPALGMLRPKNDPAKTAGSDVLEGLRKIAAAKAPFISRGDKSGTHAAELRYWKDAGVDLNVVKREWYKEIGQGMGPALNTASAQNAYVSPTAAPGCHSRTAAILRFWSRGTGACSTSTASCS